MHCEAAGPVIRATAESDQRRTVLLITAVRAVFHSIANLQKIDAMPAGAASEFRGAAALALHAAHDPHRSLGAAAVQHLRVLGGGTHPREAAGDVAFVPIAVHVEETVRLCATAAEAHENAHHDPPSGRGKPQFAAHDASDATGDGNFRAHRCPDQLPVGARSSDLHAALPSASAANEAHGKSVVGPKRALRLIAAVSTVIAAVASTFRLHTAAVGAPEGLRRLSRPAVVTEGEVHSRGIADKTVVRFIHRRTEQFTDGSRAAMTLGWRQEVERLTHDAAQSGATAVLCALLLCEVPVAVAADQKTVAHVGLEEVEETSAVITVELIFAPRTLTAPVASRPGRQAAIGLAVLAAEYLVDFADTLTRNRLLFLAFDAISAPVTNGARRRAAAVFVLHGRTEEFFGATPGESESGLNLNSGAVPEGSIDEAGVGTFALALRDGTITEDLFISRYPAPRLHVAVWVAAEVVVPKAAVGIATWVHLCTWGRPFLAQRSFVSDRNLTAVVLAVASVTLTARAATLRDHMARRIVCFQFFF